MGCPFICEMKTYQNKLIKNCILIVFFSLCLHCTWFMHLPWAGMCHYLFVTHSATRQGAPWRKQLGLIHLVFLPFLSSWQCRLHKMNQIMCSLNQIRLSVISCSHYCTSKLWVTSNLSSIIFPQATTSHQLWAAYSSAWRLPPFTL